MKSKAYCPIFISLYLLVITITPVYAASTLPNVAVFNWVEYKFPDLFPKSQTVKSELTHEGIHYDLRSWSGDWGTRYLGITDDGEIIGLGDYTENELQSFGYIDDWEDAVNADNDNVYRFDINEALANITLTDAGTWHPKVDNDTSSTGTLALYGKSLLKINNDDQYSLAIGGWEFAGSDTTLAVPPTTKIALLTPNEDGTLYLNTDTYIDDPVINGTANIIIVDYNDDGRDDILLPASNETPCIGRESTAYLSNQSGTFNKVQWGDDLLAHGANLIYINGEPIVYTATFMDGQTHPIITYENGQFETTELNNLQNVMGGMDNIVLFDSITRTYNFVSAETCRDYDGSTNTWEWCGIGIFEMAGYDIASSQPIQEITTWLSSIDEYREYGIEGGRAGGWTHNFDIMNDDLNNDGREDAMVLTMMWVPDEYEEDYPSKIDIVLASENGFYNATEELNPDIPVTADISDHQPVQFDIDNSGINTYFFSDRNYIYGAESYHDHVRSGQYALLNDGTGRLRVGLHDEFYIMAEYVKNFIDLDGNNRDHGRMPAFIAIPQKDGTVNFLVEYTDDDLKFVNVPIHWNPTIHFNKDITINDRNNSKLMRTWAGDDVIYDTNANSPAHIDGGFGVNKCVYSGNSSQYTITKNTDGSFGVVSDDGIIDDTIVNIKTVIFTDIEIDLSEI